MPLLGLNSIIATVIVTFIVLGLLSIPIGWGVGRALVPLISVLQGMRDDANERTRIANEAKDKQLQASQRESRIVRTIEVRLTSSTYSGSTSEHMGTLAQKVRAGGFQGVRYDSQSYPCKLWVGIPSDSEASTTALAKLTEIVSSAINLNAEPYRDVTE